MAIPLKTGELELEVQIKDNSEDQEGRIRDRREGVIALSKEHICNDQDAPDSSCKDGKYKAPKDPGPAKQKSDDTAQINISKS